MLVCDEAHRLKNRENQTSMALNSLKCRRRVLLSGTPMQNDLEEFFAMVDFTNHGVLGTPEDFRRKIRAPILRGREPSASEKEKKKMLQKQQEMSTIVNEFILRRVNTLNAQHLPPKLVQVVCCKLTDMQQNIYNHLIGSKAMQQITDGKQVRSPGHRCRIAYTAVITEALLTPRALFRAGQLPLVDPDAHEALQPPVPHRGGGQDQRRLGQERGEATGVVRRGDQVVRGPRGGRGQPVPSLPPRPQGDAARLP